MYGTSHRGIEVVPLRRVGEADRSRVRVVQEIDQPDQVFPKQIGQHQAKKENPRRAHRLSPREYRSESGQRIEADEKSDGETGNEEPIKVKLLDPFAERGVGREQEIGQPIASGPV